MSLQDFAQTDVTGMWESPDGDVRKLLLPNGRYLVMLGHGAERRQGEYAVIGGRIEYRSDDGTAGAGLLIDGVMYSAKGIPLYPADLLELAS